jgi:hypothetical protein
MNKTVERNRPPKSTNWDTANKSPVNVMATNVHLSTAQRKLSFCTLPSNLYIWTQPYISMKEEGEE